MSWDILLLDVNDDVRDASAIETRPIPPLRNRAKVLDVLKSIFLGMDISDPLWVEIDGEDFSIRLGTGRETPVEALQMIVHGSTNAALEEIDRLCALSGWRAFDSASGEFLKFPATRS